MNELTSSPSPFKQESPATKSPPVPESSSPPVRLVSHASRRSRPITLVDSSQSDLDDESIKLLSSSPPLSYSPAPDTAESDDVLGLVPQQSPCKDSTPQPAQIHSKVQPLASRDDDDERDELDLIGSISRPPSPPSKPPEYSVAATPTIPEGVDNIEDTDLGTDMVVDESPVAPDVVPEVEEVLPDEVVPAEVVPKEVVSEVAPEVVPETPLDTELAPQRLAELENVEIHPAVAPKAEDRTVHRKERTDDTSKLIELEIPEQQNERAAHYAMDVDQPEQKPVSQPISSHTHQVTEGSSGSSVTVHSVAIAPALLYAPMPSRSSLPVIQAPSSPMTAPSYSFDSASSDIENTPPEPPSPKPKSPNRYVNYMPSYTLPSVKSLPMEFHRKSKSGKQRKRDKEKERDKSEGKKDAKEEWAPMGLNKWGATVRANPVHKRVARATKCLSTYDWNVSINRQLFSI
jgi:chromatin modification-related protein VID21